MFTRQVGWQQKKGRPMRAATRGKNIHAGITQSTPVEPWAPHRTPTPAPLRQRLRDPEWRRYGYLLMAGNTLGTALAFAAMFFATSVIGTDALAQAGGLAGTTIASPLNRLWTLAAALPVFGTQALFTMLDAGTCRGRETANVLTECVADTCLCGFLFYAWGFAFMVSSGSPFFGTAYFFVPTAVVTYTSTALAFVVFWLFQFAFAETCSTLRRSVVGDHPLLGT